MKALVFWSNGIKLGTVKKMDLEKAIEQGYRQPELVYEVVESINCTKNELDYKQVLGEEHNYYTDNIGFTSAYESYVCPITEEQYNQLVALLDSHRTKEQELLQQANKELDEKKKKDIEKLEDINSNFESQSFKINNKTIKIIGLANLNNKVSVKIDDKQDTATLLYGLDKVYLDFMNRDKIEITKCQELINFLWNTFGYRGNAELYNYTSEYKNNYLE